MKGYKTLIVNTVAALVAVGAIFGVVIPQDDSTAVTAGVLAVINIVLRVMTSTPVGKAE